MAEKNKKFVRCQFSETKMSKMSPCHSGLLTGNIWRAVWGLTRGEKVRHSFWGQLCRCQSFSLLELFIFGFFFFTTMKLASLCKMASAIFYSLLAIKSNGHFKRVRDVNVANKHFQLPLRSSFLCNPVDFGSSTSFYSGFVD